MEWKRGDGRAIECVWLKGLVSAIEVLLGMPLPSLKRLGDFREFTMFAKHAVPCSSGLIRRTIADLVQQAASGTLPKMPKDMQPTDVASTAALIHAAAKLVADYHGDPEEVEPAAEYLLVNLMILLTSSGSERRTPYSFFRLHFRVRRAYDALLTTPDGDADELMRRSDAVLAVEQEHAQQCGEDSLVFIAVTFDQLRLLRVLDRETVGPRDRLIWFQLVAMSGRDKRLTRTTEEFDAIGAEVDRKLGLITDGIGKLLAACGYTGKFDLRPTEVLPDLSKATNVQVRIGNMDGQLVLGTEGGLEESREREEAGFIAINLGEVLRAMEKGGLDMAALHAATRH